MNLNTLCFVPITLKMFRIEELVLCETEQLFILARFLFLSIHSGDRGVSLKFVVTFIKCKKDENVYV